MSGIITLDHGSGYGLTRRLIEDVFVKSFGTDEPLTDSAVVGKEGCRTAFTTDSYVIDPLFFPGGDIGKLAVCGTVNDLAVSGATPEYISASYIIEEGLLVEELVAVVSSMSREASAAGVKIVTGDTKVVEKGKCDKLFITTSGIGRLPEEFFHIGSGTHVSEGDSLIINGPVGNHAVAVLGARKKLSFRSGLTSDCTSLNHLIADVLADCPSVSFMRDLTRGGLAAVLNELSEITGWELEVAEDKIPVDNQVRGLCEILGFDPLYLANEGKVLIVVPEKESLKVLDILRKRHEGMEAEVIGRVTGRVTGGTIGKVTGIVDGKVTGKIRERVAGKERGRVILRTATGGSRILFMPSGLQLPRIC